MKATGVVRSVDGLGRLVIPKEIRRVLRIREGDPLEIYTDRDGSIILKKYSPIGEMADFAAQYAMALYKSTGMTAVITDREKIVAAVGAGKTDVVGVAVSDGLSRQMESRKMLMSSKNDASFINITDIFQDFPHEYYHEIICPIIADCEVIGAVVLLAKNEIKNPTETELKIASCGAAFLGLHTS